MILREQKNAEANDCYQARDSKDNISVVEFCFNGKDYPGGLKHQIN